MRRGTFGTQKEIKTSQNEGKGNHVITYALHRAIPLRFPRHQKSLLYHPAMHGEMSNEETQIRGLTFLTLSPSTLIGRNCALAWHPEARALE